MAGFGSDFESDFDSRNEFLVSIPSLNPSLDSDFGVALQARNKFPIPQVKKMEQDEEEVPIIKDDPLEDLLLKEPELFNQYVEDVKLVNMKELSKKVLTDNYLERFEAVWPKFSNKQRKLRCKKFLEQNPGMRTMNPEVLWQRIFYYHVDYGKKARRVFPPTIQPIQLTRENLPDESSSVESLE